MRTEVSRTFPIPLKKGFDYIDDFRLWPDWYTGITKIVEPETGTWMEPGDSVKFHYRMLGRRMDGVLTLDERLPGELVRMHSEILGLPNVHFDYHYKSTGPEAFTLKIVMEVDEEQPVAFFGKVLDKLLLPRTLERDLKHSLDHLEEIFIADLFG